MHLCLSHNIYPEKRHRNDLFITFMLRKNLSLHMFPVTTQDEKSVLRLTQ